MVAAAALDAPRRKWLNPIRFARSPNGRPRWASWCRCARAAGWWRRSRRRRFPALEAAATGGATWTRRWSGAAACWSVPGAGLASRRRRSGRRSPALWSCGARNRWPAAPMATGAATAGRSFSRSSSRGPRSWPRWPAARARRAGGARSGRHAPLAARAHRRQARPPRRPAPADHVGVRRPGAPPAPVEHALLAHPPRTVRPRPGAGGGRIRAFYEVQAQRVEPVGLVYLWPKTN